MNISDEDTKELDSYGVWVKTPEDGDSNISTNEELDLPDFDDTDFSDMFKDDSQFSTSDTSLDNDFSSDLDSTLSTDELANITETGDVTIENIEQPAFEDSDDDFSLDDISAQEDSLNDISTDELAIEESSINDFSIDDITTDNIQSEELSTEEDPLENFEINDLSSDSVSEEINIEQSNESDISLDDFSTEEIKTEEEISLDDFMESGFSDDSVASGNNGFEPGFEPGGVNNPNKSEDTEELSLDDFMDEGFSEETSDSSKQDDIEEESPLEMDISFDDSADSVQTEDNLSLDTEYNIDDEDDFEQSTVIQNNTEDISLDSFGNDNLEIDSSTNSSTEVNIDTEEIDLSDFGIDASAEETPITQDVEEAKNKDVIVDYDLSVGNENAAIAPIVSEVDSKTSDEVEEIIDVVEDSKPNTTVVDNSLLQQIVADLSGLKEEINRLKTNIEEIKTIENQDIQDPSKTIDETNIVIEDSNSDGGFFGTDDGDDTIALSFDELDNIMNTADFSSTETENVQNSSIEDDSTSEQETVNQNTEEIQNEDDIFNNDVNNETEKDISFDFENEKLEEPVIDEIVLDDNDNNESFEDDLPSEISIPTEDEMIVGNDTSDFMDSITESNDFSNDNLNEVENNDIPTEISEDDVLSIDDDLTIPDFDNLSNDDNSTIEQSSVLSENEDSSDDFTENTQDDSETNFANVDEMSTIDNDVSEDIDIIENEDTPIEETSITDDEIATESYINDSFSEVDNLDNDLSSSNIDYLTAKDSSENNSSLSNDEQNISVDLKQDIKSVLLYMDQLLENLPDEKIIEFAKSDEFTTYKKLFSELGLS